MPANMRAPAKNWIDKTPRAAPQLSSGQCIDEECRLGHELVDLFFHLFFVFSPPPEFSKFLGFFETFLDIFGFFWVLPIHFLFSSGVG